MIFLETKSIHIKIFCLLVGFIAFSCSPESNSFVSKSYHNLTARDNAYFLARERMKQVDKKIDEARLDDYNKVIHVLALPDTNKLKAQQQLLEDIFKKASLPIQKHKNSKWVDDCYILVGKVKFYKGEWPQAIETYKYVNSKSKDPVARHEAIIHLMRLFLTAQNFDYVNSVNYFLKKEKMNSTNQREYLLTRAQYFIMQERYKEALKDLEAARPLIKKKDVKSRVHFIIGQIHQLLNNDKDSYQNYKAVLKHNPPYELSFYTRLYMAQVTNLSKSGDKKRIEKYFKKLLKDLKNQEYKDKIYYEMAKFEFKQGHLPGTIEYLQKSVAASAGNNYQKASSYLMLAEIHYEKLQDFETSKLYYDSTIALMDKKDKRYRLIAARQEVLQDFVTQLRIIQKEDSLLRIATMDSITLAKHIDKVIEKEKEDLKKAEAREKAIAAKNASNNNNNGSNSVPGGGESTWHYYNEASITRGKSEFVKRWGQRKLEDNWRRSTKEAVQDNTDNSENQDADSSDIALESKEKEEKEAKVDKTKYYKEIPFSDEAKAASLLKVENALYNVGKIYDQKLDEKGNAIKSFEKHLTRFPASKLKSEVLYFLYLLYKEKPDPKFENYAAMLHEEFPNSIYSKLIRNPNYLAETKETSQHINKLYRDAYNLYKAERFFDADSAIKAIRVAYKENDIEDKLQLLEILVIGQTKNALIYKGKLEEFIANQKESVLLPKAKELLASTEEYIKLASTGGKTLNEDQVKYKTDVKDKPHMFIVAVHGKNLKPVKIVNALKKYNGEHYKPGEIQTEVVQLNDTLNLISIKTLVDKSGGMIYYTQIKNFQPFQSETKNLKYDLFVITEENFSLFNRYKKLESYLNFFEEHYKK